jgi:hypothetical protein
LSAKLNDMTATVVCDQCGHKEVVEVPGNT